MKSAVAKSRREALRRKFYEEAARGGMNPAVAIRNIRKFLGMTQVEYAKARGVSLRILKEIEQGTGNPTLGTLNKLLFGTGLQVLVGIPPPGGEDSNTLAT